MFLVPAPTIAITGSPVNEDFHVGLTLTFIATATFNIAVDTNLTILSSWTSQRNVNTTEVTHSGTNPMAYSTTLTVDLQDTQSVPESYSVEFNVLSTMYIVGVYTNKTRIIIVEGMYCCIAT